MSTWEPLAERNQPKDALYEGVPAWLQPSLAEWAERKMTPEGWVDLAGLRRLVRVLKWDVGGKDLWAEFQRRLTRADELLDVIHYLLGLPAASGIDYYSVAEVTLCLDQAGSVWTVGLTPEEVMGLVRRLPAEVGEAVDAVASVEDRSGEHLRCARANLYGREPNPTEAYRDAVRAVEAAAKPVVSPTNTLTTLGTIKADIKQAPEDKFSFAIKTRQGSAPRATAVDMLGLLYAGQHDRHGDAEAPVSVSRDEADAAFHLAVTLVHWFRSGAITRRPAP